MSNPTTLDAERFVAEHSDAEILEFVGQVLGRVWRRSPDGPTEVPIHGPDNQRRLGHVVPLLETTDDPEMARFVASFQERLKNPPERYLSFDEFIDQVRQECSRSRQDSTSSAGS